MPDVRSGPMRHVATVQRATFSRDASTNQKVPTWSAVATIRGLLRPLRGWERVNAQQLKAEVSDVFETRWQGSLALDASMQLVVEGRTLKVSSVIDVDNRHKELHVYCTEVPVPNR